MSVIISRKSVDAIVNFEVTSEKVYNKKYIHPILPGVNSGITIGIGYDLGMSSVQQIEKDWAGYVSNNDLLLLRKASGLTQSKASSLMSDLRNVSVSFHDAEEVFIQNLKSYAKSALHIYPGLDLLNYDTQGAIISLIYNRGALIDNSDRRKEMKAMIEQIANKDYKGLAASFRSMKRLWDAKTANGLIIRREIEASLVDGGQREYQLIEKVEL